MFNQAGAVAKTFPAVPALVRPRPGVHPLVLDQARVLTEEASTVLARKRLFSSVDFAVLREATALAEKLPTVRALVRPLPGVSLPASGQAGLVAVEFSHTRCTRRAFLRCGLSGAS